MTDKLVTHADLDAIAVIERECSALTCEGRASDLLRRLRAAAEADQPPLPEGWVIRTSPDGEAHDIAWHLNGALYRFDDATGALGRADEIRDRLSPLRPTVTEAQFRAAVEVHRDDGRVASAEDCIRAAFKAAGIEVRDV